MKSKSTTAVRHLLTVWVVVTVLTLCEVNGQTIRQTTTAPGRGRGSRNGNNANRGSRRRGSGSRRRGPERFGCEEIYLPMCKGLISYTHTKLPNQFNHTTQAQVYNELQSLWLYMDHSCSRNIRTMTCAKYLPQCNGRRPAKGPCKRTCMASKRRCAKPLKRELGLKWADVFSCAGLPGRSCVRPMRERRCRNDHPVCLENEAMPVCANLTFTWGTLPNMFGQCNIQEINTEVTQFDSLIATNCHINLRFLLCGVYSPFCVRNEVPFTFPCREICEEIREACEPYYRSLNHNLPWPTKLQCHRYPTSDDQNYECVMPLEGGTFAGGK